VRGFGSWRIRFTSLPTQIVVAVFSAALVTGIAVTAISVGSAHRFLRAKMEDRFPELLRWTARELDQWYAQCEVDIATLASSESLVAGLREGASDGDVAEAGRYLAHVQDDFPQYRRLFVLDPRGAMRVSVGGDLELPPLPPAMLESLARTEVTRVGEVVGTLDHRVQMISAPITSGGRQIGSLHAMLQVASLENQLGERDLDEGTGLYVIGPRSTVLAHSPGAPARLLFDRPLPAADEVSVVADYTTTEGEGVHVVGSALRFDRFNWTLSVEQNYDIAFAPAVGAMGRVMAINVAIVLAFGALALAIARSVVRPIRALSDSAGLIAQGETDIEIAEVSGHDEIAVLSRALREMVDRLRRNQVELQRKQDQIERANTELTRANDELQRSNEVLEQLSFTDGLTHLHNHRYFQDRLRLEAKRADRSREPLALILIDIDNFKWLNDRYGHAAGDEVLRRVATILNQTARETDLVARYGGEEFALLAPRTDPKGAVGLGERVRQAVADMSFHGLDSGAAEGIAVTTSVGVSVYRSDIKRFFDEADRALYQAKREGKDCVVLFPGSS
jgi:diguanylate cyclase (GGDEF)-like protein